MYTKSLDNMNNLLSLELSRVYGITDDDMKNLSMSSALKSLTNVESSNAVHSFLETYKPKVFIAAGCAGSIKVSDVRLLDVVAATQCDMPFVKGSITSGEDGKMNV
jgi:hypothetical protein